MASEAPRRGGQPLHAQARSTPRLETQHMNSNQRFSFVAETPLRLQRGAIGLSSPTDSYIDDSPLSPVGQLPMPRSSPPPPLELHQSQYGEDKKEPERLGTPYRIEPPQQAHPAHFAPFVDSEPQHLKTQQHPTTIPMQTFSPAFHASNSQYHPSQTPQYQHAAVSTTQKSYHDTEYNRADVPPISPSTPKTPAYNPYSLAGPNVTAENHKPGQISHPNSASNPHWETSLCAAGSACCLAMPCPCLVYGKTQYRLSQKAAKRDGTDLLGYEATNSSCALFAAAFCLGGVLAMIQRGRVRRLYKISGSVGDDCLKGCCCCCCVLAQDENEMRFREERIRRFAGPASYVSPVGMSYPPPPR